MRKVSSYRSKLMRKVSGYSPDYLMLHASSGTTGDAT